MKGKDDAPLQTVTRKKLENLIKQDCTAIKPTEKWLTDITEVPCVDGKLYFATLKKKPVYQTGMTKLRIQYLHPFRFIKEQFRAILEARLCIAKQKKHPWLNILPADVF